MSGDESQLKAKLLELIQQAIDQDTSLREEYKIDNKFRFIHERLIDIQAHVKDRLQEEEVADEETGHESDEQQRKVYVHLFNAQGQQVETWKKLLLPSLYYDYSVNRPIYADKSSVESLIRNKANPAQHGYIEVAVDEEAVLSTQEESGLVKIRDGALDPARFVSFVHQGKAYKLTEDGELRFL